MRIKFPVSLLVIFSIWTSIFAPFVSSQNQVKQIPIDKNGLEFRLTEAPKTTPQSTPTPILPIIENLSQTEAEAIFQRLPQMPTENADAELKLRADSLKPPRTGNIIPLKFPADETKKAPDLPAQTNKPLEIERISPEGRIALVSDLSVTFSQPMISVTSQTEASENVPIKLTPEVKGKWRWLGTQTLIFDAESRFPMATKFTATIPAGTKSAISGALAKDSSWTFTTPPPKIEGFAPKTPYEGVHPNNVFIGVKFNQEIDGNAVLQKVRVIANGKQFPLKLAGENNVTGWIEGIGEVKAKQWLKFQTIETLPMNTEVRVVFEQSIPSAEGPAVSEAEQVFTFKTMGDFKLNEALCNYSREITKCQTSDDFRLRYSRSFNPVPFDKSLIKIEPPIENVEINANNSEILIKGKKKPNTDYKVTLSGEAIDYYKQKVGKDISTTFNVTTDKPQFFAQGGDFVTLDPNAKPIFSVYSKNQPNFKVRLYSVLPEDYPNFGKFLDDFRNNRIQLSAFNIGKLIFDKTVEPKAEIDSLSETRIDLSEALPNKFGHAILIAEPSTQKIQDNLYQYYNRPIVAWVQSTNIGVDTFTDYEKLVVFASDLKTGKPFSQTEFSINYYSNLFPKLLTNDAGIVNFERTALGKNEFDGNTFLIARKGEDSAIFDNTYIDWRSYRQANSKRWFVFDDRKMYRPNEEVSVKGYLRKVTGGKFTDLAELGEIAKKIYYSWRDPQNNEITKGVIEPNIFGAFDLKFKLPENINLGYQRISFWARGDKPEDFWTTDQDRYNPEFVHTFQVQEFRRPEFEVSVAAENPAPYMVGNSAFFLPKPNITLAEH